MSTIGTIAEAISARPEFNATEAVRTEVARVAEASQAIVKAVDLRGLAQMAAAVRPHFEAVQAARTEMAHVAEASQAVVRAVDLRGLAQVAAAVQLHFRAVEAVRADFARLLGTTHQIMAQAEVHLREMVPKAVISDATKETGEPTIEQEYEQCMVGLLAEAIQDELPLWLIGNDRLAHWLAVAAFEFSVRFQAVTGQTADLRSLDAVSEFSALLCYPENSRTPRIR